MYIIETFKSWALDGPLKTLKYRQKWHSFEYGGVMCMIEIYQRLKSTFFTSTSKTPYGKENDTQISADEFMHFK